jgi:hypothetical protein
VSVQASLLEVWTERLGSDKELDLAEHGREVVPELLAAYTPDDFRLSIYPGSTLWIADDGVAAELTAELEPTTAGLEGTGVIQRRLDTARQKADHIKFELPEEGQGEGRGRRVLRASVDLYDALGIRYVELTAVDTGRYAWAAAGFSFRTAESRQDVVAGVEFAAELLGMPLVDLDPEQIQPWQIALMPPAEDFTLRDALAALDPEGLESGVAADENLEVPLYRPGKLLLLADEVPGWQGFLDLQPSDDNIGLDTLYAYTD